jgi:hypothetical protein
MSAAGAEAGASEGLNDVYEALERYNWDDDVEFQAGLSAILGSNSSPEQAAELALRARCFYYARYVDTVIMLVLCTDCTKKIQHYRRLRSVQSVP